MATHNSNISKEELSDLLNAADVNLATQKAINAQLEEKLHNQAALLQRSTAKEELYLTTIHSLSITLARLTAAQSAPQGASNAPINPS
ncbi:MAG: hypothetical protein GY938_05105 [Ketobacter sp.]|nr:hypothetical protein [Ketobacter sp.]